jgi:hypothetical protein
MLTVHSSAGSMPPDSKTYLRPASCALRSASRSQPKRINDKILIFYHNPYSAHCQQEGASPLLILPYVALVARLDNNRAVQIPCLRVQNTLTLELASAKIGTK